MACKGDCCTRVQRLEAEIGQKNRELERLSLVAGLAEVQRDKAVLQSDHMAARADLEMDHRKSTTVFLELYRDQLKLALDELVRRGAADTILKIRQMQTRIGHEEKRFTPPAAPPKG